VTLNFRVATAVLRLAAAGWLLAGNLAAQDALSPLPPPVTRGQYRAQWFEFLSAFSENDQPAANKALEEMLHAGRKVGVHRLADFSRTAVFLGRRLEKEGKPDRAEKAYDAALELDASNPDALAARLSFLTRHGRVFEALRFLPTAAADFFSTHEARVATLSSLGLWVCLGIAGMLLGIVLALAVRHGPRAAHDIAEKARRSFGRSAALPLGLLVLALPVFVGLGPGWLLLYWGALLYSYADGRERVALAAGFVCLALIPPLLAWVTSANIEQRSPLFVAAVDLDERREDASAEDGLRQAAAVFPEDSDVWFLLGIFAERSGDMQRAQQNYTRAMQADPTDYRPIMNRGNVRFAEGEYGEAVRDYIEAGKRTRSADIYYNLSLARGEAYDFDGQATAIQEARQISPSQVNGWTSTPTVSRVVPAGYSLARARNRIATWNAQPKSRRLPGHGAAAREWKGYFSAWSLAPIAALLLGIGIDRFRRRRGLAYECGRCGRAFCDRCRRFGDPTLYCMACSRILVRKEGPDIEEQVFETRAMQRRLKWRHRASRFFSLVAPGSSAFRDGRPIAGAVVLFFFFTCVAAAIVDGRLFDPLTLPAEGPWRASVVIGAALAAVVWLRGQMTARRAPSGS
jgi:tetratricopeptide (TPR) repeat protein